MTDAAAASVEDTSATVATAKAETTATDATTSASATDAAKSAEASASAEPGKEETDEVPELTALSKEERKQYSEALKKLDPSHRKTLNRLFDEKAKAAAAATKERETLAEQNKSLAGVAEIISKIESDPDGAIAQLQKLYPSKVKPNGKVEVPEEMVRAVESTLDDASKPFAKVIAPAVFAILQQHLKPIEEHVQAEKDKAAQAQAQADFQSFEKDCPDWKEFEAPMLEWGAKIPKGTQATVSYLKALYTLASSDAKQKAATKTSAEAVLAKAAKGAANAEPDTTSVSPARVAKKPVGSVAEAYAQAKEEAARGELTA